SRRDARYLRIREYRDGASCVLEIQVGEVAISRSICIGLLDAALLVSRDDSPLVVVPLDPADDDLRVAGGDYVERMLHFNSAVVNQRLMVGRVDLLFPLPLGRSHMNVP